MLTSADDDDAPAAAKAMSPAAGWYPDPLGHRRFRYWDGDRWTPYGSDDGLEVAADALPELGPVAPDEPDRHRRTALLVSIALLAAVAGITFWQAGPDPVVAGGSMSGGGVDDRIGGEEGIEATPATPPNGQPGEREPIDQVQESGDSFGRWPEVLGPTTVVYREERGDGDSREVLVASDPPRSAVRSPDTMTLVVVGEQTVVCDASTCARDVAPSSVDLLTNYVTFGSPWSNAKSSEREIAGRDAECATDDVSGSTLCWDVRTGLMLRNEPGGPGLTVTAVEVRDPQPGDFELPHEIGSGGVGDLG